MQRKNKMIKLILNELKEILNDNETFFNSFIYFESLKEIGELPNGRTIFDLKFLNNSINILGVNVETNWEMIDGNVSVNTLLSNSHKKTSFLQYERGGHQDIRNDWAEFIFLYSIVIYQFLEYNNSADGEQVILFDFEKIRIDAYYDIIYT